MVHDENGFNADELQRVTHDLSYMFARATKDKGKKGKKRAEETVFEKAGVMWDGGVSGPRLKDTMFYL